MNFELLHVQSGPTFIQFAQFYDKLSSVIKYTVLLQAFQCN